ncbi:hypothetical protein ACFQT0_00075 [Hymenobacter humi]|uniref:Uncharacterized protein n=1 Tax=Hymenobacter humi TaxID=1411620 RepID=A0ABW2U1U1_9BACT
MGARGCSTAGTWRCASLLAVLAAEGMRDGWLRTERFDWAKLGTDADGATYAGQVRARHVICCEGAAVVRNPYFSWLPITPNQGEVLDVECPGLSPDQVLNRGAYVVPVGPERFRVGLPTAGRRLPKALRPWGARNWRPGSRWLRICRLPWWGSGPACGRPCATAGRCWARTRWCRR